MKLALSISQRLAAGLGLILSICAVALCYGIWTMGQSAVETRQLVDEQFARERVVEEWVQRVEVNLVRTMALAKSGGDAQLKAYFDPDMKAMIGIITELKKKIDASDQSAGRKDLLAEIEKQRAAYMGRRAEAFALLDTGKRAEADKIIETGMGPAVAAYRNLMQKLLAEERAQIEAAKARLQARAESARTMMLLLGALAVAGGVLVAWQLARSVTRPLREVVAVAQRVATGDLRGEIVVTGSDETGALLAAVASMQKELRHLIGAVKDDVGAVSAYASELVAAAAGMAGSSASQTDAVTSTAASVEQLTVSIAQVSESARQASAVVEETVRVSDNGLSRGNQVQAEIAAIDSAVADFGGQMEGLRAQAADIGTVVKLIREIAEQTNLLALNAAIEAARAGEQGRGFAVVADEVRKLAERTSTATSDIQKTIEGIQGNMEAAGGRLENVKSRVREGVVSIRELVEPLKDLQHQAARAAEGLRELSSATSEQKQVSEQIARNTERIANSAELSHAAISQSRDTAGQLAAMAQRLLGSTARFQLV